MILAPGTSEVGLGAAPNCSTSVGSGGIPWANSGRASHAQESQTLQTIRKRHPLFINHAKLFLGAQGAPKEPKGIPTEPKEATITSGRSRWVPKKLKGEQQITRIYIHKQKVCKLPIHRQTAAG